MKPILLPFELPLEQNTKLTRVADFPGMCEGIVFDASGNMFVSGLSDGTIYNVASDGAVSVWAKTGHPNGHKVLANGTHLVCDASQHAILLLDLEGRVIGTAASKHDGLPLRAPNDVTSLDEAGGFYFTDPANSTCANPDGSIFYVDDQGKSHLVADLLAYPNGIVVRPGGKTLLVSESEKNRILSYPILSPGEVGPMRVFAELPAKANGQIDNQPDGICLDKSGNLYIAHFGMGQVQVISPGSELLRRYAAGNLCTTNVAFGGPNMDQLYVTGALVDEKSAGALFRLDLAGARGLRIIHQLIDHV